MKQKFKILLLFIPFLFSSQDKKELESIFIQSLFVNRDFEKSYAFFDSSITNQFPISELTDPEEQARTQLESSKIL